MQLRRSYPRKSSPQKANVKNTIKSREFKDEQQVILSINKAKDLLKNMFYCTQFMKFYVLQYFMQSCDKVQIS